MMIINQSLHLEWHSQLGTFLSTPKKIINHKFQCSIIWYSHIIYNTLLVYSTFTSIKLFNFYTYIEKPLQDNFFWENRRWDYYRYKVDPRRLSKVHFYINFQVQWKWWNLEKIHFYSREINLTNMSIDTLNRWLNIGISVNCQHEIYNNLIR